MSGATAAGLLQCSVGRHSIAPCTALAIGDERGCTARLRVIKVRPHHAAPTPVTLLKVPWRIDYKLAVLVYKCLHGSWHRHTSPTNFTIQQSRSLEGVCVPLRLMNCLFPLPNCQPTATEHLQWPLYGSGTVFRSISHQLRYFPSSALA